MPTPSDFPRGLVKAPFCLYYSVVGSDPDSSFAFPSMEFTINAGGLLVKHNEEQLISLVANFIANGKPGSGFIVQNVACISKHDQDGQLMLGRDDQTLNRMFSKTSDDIMSIIKRWATEAN